MNEVPDSGGDEGINPLDVQPTEKIPDCSGSGPDNFVGDTEKKLSNNYSMTFFGAPEGSEESSKNGVDAAFPGRTSSMMIPTEKGPMTTGQIKNEALNEIGDRFEKMGKAYQGLAADDLAEQIQAKISEVAVDMSKDYGVPAALIRGMLSPVFRDSTDNPEN